MDLAWCPGIVAELQQLIEYQVDSGAECDEVRSLTEETFIEVAEPLSQACEDSGIRLPVTDQAMRAVLERDCVQAPVVPRFGVVLVLADGRLGVGDSRGAVIESAGDGLCLIGKPEPGRYVDAYFLPHVFYWEDI